VTCREPKFTFSSGTGTYSRASMLQQMNAEENLSAEMIIDNKLIIYIKFKHLIT
jgi:hypothetical protein